MINAVRNLQVVAADKDKNVVDAEVKKDGTNHNPQINPTNGGLPKESIESPNMQIPKTDPLV
jgi:hypothetical protein